MGRVRAARAQNRLDEALAVAHQAIAQLEQLGRRRRLAQLLNKKGDLLRYKGALSEAAAAYLRTEE